MYSNISIFKKILKNYSKMIIHSDLNSLPISTSTKNNYQYCWYHSKLVVSYFQNCQKSQVKKDLLNTLLSEAVVRWCSSKQMFLKFSQYSQENMRWSIFLKRLQPLRPATLLKKTPTQVFSREICEIFTSFFYRTPPEAASVLWNLNSI